MRPSRERDRRSASRPHRSGERLELVAPDLRYRDAFIRMLDDYRDAGDTRKRRIQVWARRNFAGYLRSLARMDAGERLRPGFVPQTTYWLLRDERDVMGTIRLRHKLTDDLRKEGGHIGYDIRPSARGRGYGTHQLALVLEKARSRGLKRVLVTCDTDNIASARVIQKNEGQFVGEVISDYSGKPVSRYWIDLSRNGAGA